jgi:quercetin dioxygenase-like cupin family protein
MEPILKLKDPYIDDRGLIQSLVSLDEPKIQSAVIIESKKESVRANHYHKEDWHYCYLISGSIDYYYRDVDDKSEPTVVRINPGDVFFTPAMLEHAMYFNEDSIFLTLGGDTRTPEAYEADLVRVDLI